MLHTNMICFCPNLCKIRKYKMSELRLHTKQTKMCNVRTHVAYENMMSRVRTYVTSKMCYIRTYATHEYAIIFCPNMCYT